MEETNITTNEEVTYEIEDTIPEIEDHYCDECETENGGNGVGLVLIGLGIVGLIGCGIVTIGKKIKEKKPDLFKRIKRGKDVKVEAKKKEVVVDKEDIIECYDDVDESENDCE